MARQRFERVELCATNGDTSEVIVLTREAAALRCVELAAEGWSVEIVELEADAVPDGPGAWSVKAAAREKYVELRNQTRRVAERASDLHGATAAAMEAGRLRRSRRRDASKLG